MRSKRFAILIGLLILLAVGTMALVQSGAGAQTKGETKDDKKHKGEVAIEMLIQLPKSPDGTQTRVGDLLTKIKNIGSSGQDGVTFDVFFDITYISNIGSSGLDGVSAGSNLASFNVDSFFDIEYEIDFDPPRYRTVQTEMLSMDLTGRVDDPSNPGIALDALRRAVSAVGGDVYVGHVTVLK